MQQTNQSDAMAYVTEWTAPDGSKRRALVERVPECDPFKGLLVADQIAVLEPKTTAALLRCAVEDWLIQQRGGNIEISRGGPHGVDGFGLLMRTHSNSHFGPVFGPTVHAALIAAAHAIADGLGVER